MDKFNIFSKIINEMLNKTKFKHVFIDKVDIKMFVNRRSEV